MKAPNRVILYARVSTEDQAASGAGIDAQLSALRTHAASHEWDVVAECVDRGISAKTIVRPELTRALNLIYADEADVLAVAKLDRLSRSVIDFARLLQDSQKDGWSIAALDLGVDTSTAAGKMVANVMASVAEWEREAIAERTRAALAARKAAGVKLGRPTSVSDHTRARIAELRDVGSSWREVAEALNAEERRTSEGMAFHANTARRLYLLDHPVKTPRRSKRRRSSTAR